MQEDTPLHSALTLHTRRAPLEDLAQTLTILETALARRVGTTHNTSTIAIAFRLLRREVTLLKEEETRSAVPHP